MSRTALWAGLFAAIVTGGIAAGIALIWPVLTMVSDPTRVQRTYYIPAQSMLPTLQLNDRIRPRRVTTLKRGDVVLFRFGEGMRVSRVVGLPGDGIAMRAGRVLIGGRAVELHAVGPGPRVNDTSTTMYVERLPGERGRHFVLDAGSTRQDDVAPMRVPPGQLFVLGDNRDFAADSRIPRDQDGAGLVPVRNVAGVVDRLLWSSGFHDLGRPIDSGAHR